MSKIKAKLGKKYKCVKRFKEDECFGGCKSFVGLNYTLVSKTTFSTKIQKNYMMCTIETKSGKDAQSVVISSEKFASYFEPVKKK